MRGVDILVVVVEPGGRSIETALSIARMARDLGIRQVGIVANKITDPGQVETVKAEMGDMPVLAVVAYDPAVQQADLQRRSVFAAGPKLVEELTKGKEKLMNLIGAGSTL